MAKVQSTKLLNIRNDTEIIAYIHISPIKRNKKNTLDCATLNLQVDDTSMQEALCYSKTKRSILAEKESTRTPIKLSRYTKTSDKKKVIINDMTNITTLNELEYSFQFCDQSQEEATTSLDQLLKDGKPEDKITACAAKS